MSLVVSVVAPGNMGAAVGRCLADHGVEVLTTLMGRGAASAARAQAAGMRAVGLAELAAADLVLSIVPPAAALPFAQQMVPVLRAAPRKPVFVDCNAVSPDTVRSIARVVDATGAPFVDAGIIGPPPGPGAVQPSIYASGQHAARLSALKSRGLDIRLLEAPIGAASALKMSFAGITKGVIAVATAMTLAASRAGTTRELREELAAREPALLASLTRKVPQMPAKAYRWVAEMQEISQFVTRDSGGEIYLGASQIYERIARALAGDGSEIQALRDFFEL